MRSSKMDLSIHRLKARSFRFSVTAIAFLNVGPADSICVAVSEKNFICATRFHLSPPQNIDCRHIYRRYKSERFNACPIFKNKKARASFPSSTLLQNVCRIEIWSWHIRNVRLACKSLAEIRVAKRYDGKSASSVRLKKERKKNLLKLKIKHTYSRADFLCGTKSDEGAIVGPLKFGLFVNGGE